MCPAIPRSAAAALGLLALVAAFSLVAPAPAQAWPWYEVRARHSEKCLDVANWSFLHGADVIQGTCWQGENQLWELQPTFNGSWFTGYYKVVVMLSGKCLDVAHASTAHLADVIQGTCGNGWNQQWKLVGTDSNWWMLVARHSGKCLDVAHMSTAHTANVIQGTCWGGYNQQWQFRQIY